MRSVEDAAGSTRVHWNLIANFVSLATLVGANLAAIPFYVQLLGAEAYGLIGFYALLTAVVQVFDFGLSATLTRDCARYRGGALEAVALWRILGAFEIIFLSVAATTMAILSVMAPTIARQWLRLEHLPIGSVSTAVLWLGLAVPVQWVTGLYRAMQIGFERQVVLAGLNGVFATARYLGVIGALWWFGATIEVFFAYLAILAVVELVVFAGVGRALMPARQEPFSLAVIREGSRALRFSSAVGFASVCWVVITQGDRLVLSKTLTLADYGVFTLAVTASSALVSVSTPFSQALLPRFTALSAQSRSGAAIQLYRDGSQWAALAGLPAALVLALFSEQVLWIWTGDRTLATRAAPILSAYALGSGVVAVGAFPYFLQYAHGKLRLHLIGQALFVGLFALGVVWMAAPFGPVAVGVLWTALNMAYLMIWSAFVHRRLAPGLHLSWLVKDIGVIFAAAAAAAIGLKFAVPWSQDRLEALGELGLVSALTLGAALLGSSSMRALLQEGARRLAARRREA